MNERSEKLRKMEEKDQIKRAIQGDELALADLLHQNYSFLIRYLLKLTMDPIIAEDLTQDTMLRCVEKIHLYNGQSQFSSWLITIASRLYIDSMRRKKLERTWQLNRYREQRTNRFMQWQMSGVGEQWTDVMEALSSLSYEMRLCVLLKHYYGYSYEEIAEIQDVPVGTVKSRIHHGLKQIRKELDSNEITHG